MADAGIITRVRRFDRRGYRTSDGYGMDLNRKVCGVGQDRKAYGLGDGLSRTQPEAYTAPSPKPTPQSCGLHIDDHPLNHPRVDDVQGLVRQLKEAANGNVAHDTVGIEELKPILDLQAQGCDLQADVLPTIRDTVPKLGQPLRTWAAKFLREAIIGRRDARLAGRSAANGHANSNSAQQLPAEWWKDEALCAFPMRWWLVTGGEHCGGRWDDDKYGPPPNYKSCRVPRELIDRMTAEYEAAKQEKNLKRIYRLWQHDRSTWEYYDVPEPGQPGSPVTPELIAKWDSEEPHP